MARPPIRRPPKTGATLIRQPRPNSATWAAPPDVAAALALLLLTASDEEEGAMLIDVIEAELEDDEVMDTLEVFEADDEGGTVTVTLGRVVAEYGADLHWSM